jgi:GAF domain-containing protein
MTTPASRAPEPGSLQTWHEDLLLLVLRGIGILGFAAIVVSLVSRTIDAFLPIYLAMYAGVILLLFFRLPYRSRAVLLMLLVYGFAVRSLVISGINGDARVFFIGFIVIGGFLFSNRMAVGFGALTAFSILVVNWLISTGRLEVSTPGSADDWLIGTSGVLVASGVIVAALDMLRTRFFKLEQARAAAQGTAEQLRQEKSDLEKSEVAHSLELWRKSNQLRAASEVARQVTELRDLASLLQNIVKLAAEQFEFYHVGLFLVDEDGRFAVLQAASSEGGRQMLEGGHKLEVGAQGIVGYVASAGKPRVALDVGADAVFFNNPYLPQTSSEMALPLMARNRVIGVLDIQSEKTHAFQQEDVDIMQTLADQLAVAIENARLFSSTQAVISQLQAVTFAQTREAWQSYLKRRTMAYQYTPLGIRTIADDAATVRRNGDYREFPVNLHGQQVGTILLRRKESAAGWNRREEELIQEVARQVALAADNSRLLEETNRRIAEEQTLGEITTRLGRTLDFDTLLQTAARELGELPDVAEAAVFVGPPPEKKQLARTGTLRG